MKKVAFITLVIMLCLILKSSFSFSQVTSNINYKVDLFVKDSVFKIGDSLYYKIIGHNDSALVIYTQKNGNNIIYYNSKGIKLMEGEQRRYLSSARIHPVGFWKEYYENGVIKSEGYYSDAPTGLWRYYYSTGQPKTMFSYATVATDSVSEIIKVGTYLEFYENGRLKIDGQYCSTFKLDTIQLTHPDPPYDSYDVIGRIPVSKKCYVWRFYDEKGILTDKIDYDREK